MNLFWMGVFYIVTAGFVGGLTNHFAIKMLFYPRKPVYLWGKKLPFTPGLIPKRRDDITKSLGEVVGVHLVTSEGLASALRKPELRSTIENKLQAWIREFCSQDRTIADLIEQHLSPEDWASFKENLTKWLQERSYDAFDWVMHSQEIGDKQIGQLFPGWDADRKEQLAQALVVSLVESIKKELSSLHGERMLKRMSGQFMEQSGGFFGALAGMFMDEDKMVVKIRKALLEQLDSEAVQAMIRRLLENKICEYEQLTVGHVLEWMSKDAGMDRMKKQLNQIPWGLWISRLEQLKVNRVLEPRIESITARVPVVVDWSLNQLETRIDSIIRSIDLPKIVEEQVAKFPIEQLEQIILSLSGKEFRAITWLGVVLGGLIGLMQTIIYALQ